MEHDDEVSHLHGRVSSHFLGVSLLILLGQSFEGLRKGQNIEIGSVKAKQKEAGISI